MADHVQSTDELETHLREQIGFLQASAYAFDAGNESEAKRIANSLRTMLHDKGRSKSLIGQLDRRAMLFVDTSSEPDPQSITSHSGLAALLMLPEQGGKYIALLDDPRLTARSIDFEEWWNQTILVDSKKRTLSRRDLVLYMAEQDGGAHIDPEIGDKYAEVSRRTSFSWTVLAPGQSNSSINGVHRASMRQICHEVLKSFIPGYVKERDYSVGGTILRNLKTTVHDRLPLKIRQGSGRNHHCDCGSGHRFKVCCGNLREP